MSRSLKIKHIKKIMEGIHLITKQSNMIFRDSLYMEKIIYKLDFTIIVRKFNISIFILYATVKEINKLTKYTVKKSF